MVSSRQQHGGGRFIVYVSAPQTKQNLWLIPSASQRRYPCSWPPSCVPGFEKLTSGDSLSQLGVQNKDLGGVRLILCRRLLIAMARRK